MTFIHVYAMCQSTATANDLLQNKEFVFKQQQSLQSLYFNMQHSSNNLGHIGGQCTTSVGFSILACPR